MTKIEAYRYLSTQHSDLAWIANVFIQPGTTSKSAETLKALAKLTMAGVQIITASFTMPYERMIVDGVHKTPAEIRDMAKALKS